MILIGAAVVMLVAILVLYRLLMTVIKVEQIKIYKEQGLDAYLEAVAAERILDHAPVQGMDGCRTGRA